MHYLSKSKLISGWQCAKRLWLEKNGSEKQVHSAATEIAFAVGHQVGDAAQSLFPDGILIEHDQQLCEALHETQEILKNPGPVTIFEATFQVDGVLIRADILVRGENGAIRLIEVKASTKVKEYHLLDCAIQLWVLEQLGLDVRQLELAHINNQFLYEGDGNYQGLFSYVDVLAEAKDLRPKVLTLIDEMRKVLSCPEPEVPMGGQCTKPFECPFYDYCQGPLADEPVSWLPGGRSAANKLMHAGYLDIRDVPKEYLTNETAERCRRVAVSGEYELDPAAGRKLNKLGWPRYYFDFETLGPAVPKFPGTKPYNAQAFQWSCHIEYEDSHITHKEFLADGTEAPMRSCAESLIAELGEQGPIYMYTAYERTIINGFINLYPDLAPSLSVITERLYDLFPITKQYYYHPDMHGSWSIKAVLPTVAPDLSYKELDIVSNGAMAEPVFLEMIDEGTLPERSDELREALLRYCKLDTLAMVRLAHFLEGRETGPCM